MIYLTHLSVCLVCVVRSHTAPHLHTHIHTNIYIQYTNFKLLTHLSYLPGRVVKHSNLSLYIYMYLPNLTHLSYLSVCVVVSPGLCGDADPGPIPRLQRATAVAHSTGRGTFSTHVPTFLVRMEGGITYLVFCTQREKRCVACLLSLPETYTL